MWIWFCGWAGSMAMGLCGPTDAARADAAQLVPDVLIAFELETGCPGYFLRYHIYHGRDQEIAANFSNNHFGTYSDYIDFQTQAELDARVLINDYMWRNLSDHPTKSRYCRQIRAEIGGETKIGELLEPL